MLCVFSYTYMYKFKLIFFLKIYLKKFSELMQMVGLIECITVDRIMGSAPNFTVMSFLCFTTKSKSFPTDLWNWSLRERRIHPVYISWQCADLQLYQLTKLARRLMLTKTVVRYICIVSVASKTQWKSLHSFHENEF